MDLVAVSLDYFILFLWQTLPLERVDSICSVSTVAYTSFVYFVHLWQQLCILTMMNDTVGLTASMFGMGGTLSNFLGQQVVEQFGHVASLTGSLIISFIPIAIFGLLMPETLGDRDRNTSSDCSESEEETAKKSSSTPYVQMD
jgi:hypothetical protein